MSVSLSASISFVGHFLPGNVFFGILKGVNHSVYLGMSFRKWHRRAYIFWVVLSVLVALSMIAFLLAPLAYY